MKIPAVVTFYLNSSMNHCSIMWTSLYFTGGAQASTDPSCKMHLLAVSTQLTALN